MSIAKPYQDPNGIWRVTTEKDEEGWTSTDLGVYYGRIDEIAFALADQALYSLTFSRVDPPLPKPEKPRNTVSVILDSESGFLNLEPEQRVSFFRTLLTGTDIVVSEGQFYGSVWLRRRDPKAALRESALAKLTAEEKDALGLR